MTPINATAGVSFNLPLGKVNLPVGTTYRASIVWGDGTSSTGTVLRQSATSTSATISGTHVYSANGTYTATIRIITPTAEQVLKFTTTVTVSALAAPPITTSTDTRFYVGRVADRLPATWGFDGVVATISSLNPLAKALDFTATIDWGNGVKETGIVRQTAAGKFEVTGKHTFPVAGKQTVTVTITGPGSRIAMAESIFTIDPVKLAA